ncbi:MAG: sensor histidine kinase [Marmoricola sp.]
MEAVHTSTLQPPPRTLRGEAWRFAVSIAFSALVFVPVANAEWGVRPTRFWIDLGVGLFAFTLIPLRRRWPFAIAVITNMLGMVSAAASGPGLLAMISLATWRKPGQIITAMVAGIASGFVYFTATPEASTSAHWISVTEMVVVTVAEVLAGLYIGTQREYVSSVNEQKRQAEEQHQMQIEKARSLEREQIAREMHDVLAHRISLISMHSGALAYRTDLNQKQVQETSALISATAREALSDLRQVLGVLRGDEPLQPQPTLSELPTLVTEARDAGMNIRFTSEVGDVSLVPETLGRTLYRVAQEALTNAAKHSPTATVSMGVSGQRGDGLTMTVSNVRRPASAAGASGAGLGLVGMRERVALAGGQLVIRDELRRFTLEAWLPWPA